MAPRVVEEEGKQGSFRAFMSKRTVLKVDTSCVKCKRAEGPAGCLWAPSALSGVDKIEIDSEKSTMTVTDSVDPVDVIVQTRKSGKRADVVTIGPPSKPDEKKPEPQKKPPKQQQQQKKYSAAAEQKAPEPPVTVYVHHVPSWPTYEQTVVYQQDPPPCSIM